MIEKKEAVTVFDRTPSGVNLSAWEPLERPLFRTFLIASVISNIGTWMHDAAAAWLMSSLTPSPFMVALMQTATTLPVFMLSLPAGALADMVDRRKLLLGTQLSMLIAAAALGILALGYAVNPVSLLFLTFALGAASAVNSPAWQSTVTQLVPREELPAAVALSGMGLNLARAVGPALGGAVAAAAGLPMVFVLNAFSFVFLIAVLYRSRPPIARGRSSALPVGRAIHAGIRFVRHDRVLRGALIRTISVVPFASVLWALLPLLAHRELDLDASGYGFLFACLGAGAVGGGLLLPRLHARFTLNGIVAGATLALALAILALVIVRQTEVLHLVLIVAGMAWMAIMASFNMLVQMAAPLWVRARALGFYLLIVQGGMAGGSLLWGMVAEHAGIGVAFAVAAIGLVAGMCATTVSHPLAESQGTVLSSTPRRLTNRLG